jgi:hypothetical protein
MSWDYVERKVKEALQITRGNPMRARQQIIAWTYEDSKLLYELTKPHMSGIVGHAIGHVMNKAEHEKDTPTPQKVPEQDINGEFGLELLKALAGGGSPQFGVENNAPRTGKAQASKSHVDAIKRMAKKTEE